MDDLTIEQRKKNMRHIKSKDTKPELILRKTLWGKGYRYRKYYKKLPGKPDVVLTKYKICVFVDSEFFHGKNFDSGYKSAKYQSLKEQLTDSDNSSYWLSKIQCNMARDRDIDAELKSMGWEVLRFWSKEVINNTEECLNEIEKAICNAKKSE